MSEPITWRVSSDAPPTERLAAAAFLLGTLLSDFNLLPAEHRKQLREIARHVLEALDEYDDNKAGNGAALSGGADQARAGSCSPLQQQPGAMAPERFEELLHGPLSHPLMPLQFTRLVLALWAVVQATGEAGALALESYCGARQERDESQ